MCINSKSNNYSSIGDNQKLLIYKGVPRKPLQKVLKAYINEERQTESEIRDARVKMISREKMYNTGITDNKLPTVGFKEGGSLYEPPDLHQKEFIKTIESQRVPVHAVKISHLNKVTDSYQLGNIKSSSKNSDRLLPDNTETTLKDTKKSKVTINKSHSKNTQKPNHKSNHDTVKQKETLGGHIYVSKNSVSYSKSKALVGTFGKKATAELSKPVVSKNSRINPTVEKMTSIEKLIYAYALSKRKEQRRKFKLKAFNKYPKVTKSCKLEGLRQLARRHEQNNSRPVKNYYLIKLLAQLKKSVCLNKQANQKMEVKTNTIKSEYKDKQKIVLQEKSSSVRKEGSSHGNEVVLAKVLDKAKKSRSKKNPKTSDLMKQANGKIFSKTISLEIKNLRSNNVLSISDSISKKVPDRVFPPKKGPSLKLLKQKSLFKENEIKSRKPTVNREDDLPSTVDSESLSEDQRYKDIKTPINKNKHCSYNNTSYKTVYVPNFAKKHAGFLTRSGSKQKSKIEKYKPGIAKKNYLTSCEKRNLKGLQNVTSTKIQKKYLGLEYPVNISLVPTKLNNTRPIREGGKEKEKYSLKHYVQSRSSSVDFKSDFNPLTARTETSEKSNLSGKLEIKLDKGTENLTEEVRSPCHLIESMKNKGNTELPLTLNAKRFDRCTHEEKEKKRQFIRQLKLSYKKSEHWLVKQKLNKFLWKHVMRDEKLVSPRLKVAKSKLERLCLEGEATKDEDEKISPTTLSPIISIESVAKKVAAHGFESVDSNHQSPSDDAAFVKQTKSAEALRKMIDENRFAKNSDNHVKRLVNRLTYFLGDRSHEEEDLYLGKLTENKFRRKIAKAGYESGNKDTDGINDREPSAATTGSLAYLYSSQEVGARTDSKSNSQPVIFDHLCKFYFGKKSKNNLLNSIRRKSTLDESQEKVGKILEYWIKNQKRSSLTWKSQRNRKNLYLEYPETAKKIPMKRIVSRQTKTEINEENRKQARQLLNLSFPNQTFSSQKPAKGTSIPFTGLDKYTYYNSQTPQAEYINSNPHYETDYGVNDLRGEDLLEQINRLESFSFYSKKNQVRKNKLAFSKIGSTKNTKPRKIVPTKDKTYYFTYSNNTKRIKPFVKKNRECAIISFPNSPRPLVPNTENTSEIPTKTEYPETIERHFEKYIQEQRAKPNYRLQKHETLTFFKEMSYP